MIKLFFSITIAKVISQLSRLIPFIGGSALPGLIALKLNPTLINQISKKNQLKSIIVTGTNGKTTTSRLLGKILKTNNIKYIHNRAGSNLLRGIASTLINQSNNFGKIDKKLAIWEVDEAIVPQAIKQLNPSIILFNNLFRDQLDRYGEIDSISNKWKQGVNNLSKNTKLIINVDDPSLNYLSQSLKAKTTLITFGLSKSLSQQQTLSHTADAIFCPKCHQPLKFTSIFTSHLGHYQCLQCNFKRSTPNNSLNKKITTNLPGIYNQYNILAATTIAKTLNLPQASINTAIKNFKPAFGRAETFKDKDKSVQILLVKNPTGFNTVLETLNKNKQLTNSPLFLILNDLIADGTDVSWIWDVDFEILKSRKTPIIISGLRAYDLALRLKYAGINPKLIQLQPKLSKAFNQFINLKGKQAYILPTYTAMLSLREILRQKKLIHSSWKD